MYLHRGSFAQYRRLPSQAGDSHAYKSWNVNGRNQKIGAAAGSAGVLFSSHMTEFLSSRPSLEIKLKQIYLHRDAFLCALNDGAVILDLPSNKYIGISSADVHDLESCLVGFEHPRGTRSSGFPRQTAATQSIVTELLQHGVLTETLSKGKSATTVGSSPTDTLDAVLPDLPSCPIFPKHVLTLLHSYWRVRRHIRRENLTPLIRHFQKINGDGRTLSPDLPKLGKLLCVFRRLRPWLYTASGCCLLDSLVLTEFLHRFHLTPTFVIGIQTMPFLAHAWVQVGDLVLNDHPDNVLPFTQLLVA